MTTQRQQRLINLPRLTKAEQDLLLGKWNQTRLATPGEHCLHHLVEIQVAQTPDAIALQYEDRCLSYLALNSRANQLADWLVSLGTGPERLIGICLPRSLELVLTLLAILKTGSAYVPFDLSYPAERLQWMLEDAQPSLLIVEDDLPPWLQYPSTLLVSFKEVSRSLTDSSSANRASGVCPENLAYLLYTSGSTGRPRGVMVTHRGICNNMHWRQATYPLTADDCMLQKTSLNFDVSIGELFRPLVAGARLVLARPEGHKDNAYLISLMREQSVTTLEFVPALLSLFMEEEGWEQTPSLRRVFCGGEVLSPQMQDTFFAGHHAALHNAYGATETAIDACSWACVRDHPLSLIPIGRPIANVEVYILDAQGRPVPIGTAGELSIGGAGLARGYHQHPDLTAERFVPNPFSHEPGARLYRTGDIARYRDDGAVEYLGRVDGQIKFHGLRIEPGEIESTIKQHPGVEECVVLLQEASSDTQYLIAYVSRSLQHRSILTKEAIRQHTSALLPVHMVPSQFVLLEEMPLTPHGKIDRQALPTLERSETGSSAFADTTTRPQIEELLEVMWGEILECSQIGLHENFFELGGHSLLGMQLISRMQGALQVELPLSALFEAPTIEQFSRQVEQALRGGQRLEVPPLVSIKRDQPFFPLSFAQQRLWLQDRLQPGNVAYLMDSRQLLPRSLNVMVLERSLLELVQRHENLRVIFQVHEGQPVQIVHSVESFLLPLIDVSTLPQKECENEVHKFVRQEEQRPFKLEEGPLFRVFLVRLYSKEHVMFVTMHHIISDGWSMQVFRRELSVLYRALLAGQPPLLPPLTVQYIDFAVWQRQWLQGQVLETQLDYWISQLSGAPQLELPVDHAPPAVRSRQGATYPFVLSTELSGALISLSREENMTLFMTLLAAFQVLLYRYTGQTDIVLGTDSANRHRVEIEGLIGFFINVLVLRTDLHGKPSFREVLRRVRSMVLGAYAYQETPFDLLVERLAPHRTLDFMPLVRALFIMQHLPQTHALPQEGKTPPTPQQRSEMAPHIVNETIATKFDLALFMREQDECISGTLNYSSDLFEASTIATLLARFRVLLHSIVEHLDVPIDLLEFFTETELTHLQQEEHALRQELHLQVGEEWFDLPGFDIVESRPS